MISIWTGRAAGKGYNASPSPLPFRSVPIRSATVVLVCLLRFSLVGTPLNLMLLLCFCFCFALAGTSFCFCLTWLRNLWRELMPCEWPWNVDLLSVWSREWRTRMSRSQAEIRGSPTWSRVNKQLPFALMRTVNTLCWGMNIIIITKGLIQISTDMLRYIYIYIYINIYSVTTLWQAYPLWKGISYVN